MQMLTYGRKILQEICEDHKKGFHSSLKVKILLQNKYKKIGFEFVQFGRGVLFL